MKSFSLFPVPRRLAALALAVAALALPGPAKAGFLPSLTPGDLVISEFRLRGPSGAKDEYIEIYNRTSAAITVQASDGSPGFTVKDSTGATVFIIPHATVIPAHGHFLGVNSVSYSLGGYPAGAATTAVGDVTWTADIADNAGLALFQSNYTFDASTRLDAVGFTTSPALYREGLGIPTVSAFSIDCAFYRFHIKAPGTAAINDPAIALTDGEPRDTDDNVADFAWVDTNGTSAGAGQRLGAPGPKNLSSPIAAHAAPRNLARALLDVSTGLGGTPNLVRNSTSDPANNATFGFVEFNRSFTNNTGAPLTRLRLRVVKLTTFPAPAGVSDLRPSSVPTGSVGTSGGSVTVNGTTLEQSPQQPNGGGWNSTFSVDAVTTATPLAAGASLNLRVRFGIQQTGTYRFALLAEALPSAAHLWIVTGDTEDASMEVEDGIQPAPVITSSLVAGGTYGNAFSTYTIAASGSPTSYSLSGLPGGLIFNTSNGRITGTPSLAGTYQATIGATNAYGTDTKTLVITIAPAPLTVSGLAVANRNYNGSAAAVLNTSGASLNGILDGDPVTLATGSASGSFADGAAAVGKTVTVSGLTLAGPAADNYTLTPPTITTTATILRVPLTVTASSGQSKIIGGNDPVFTSTLTSGALVGAEVFSGALGRVAGETAGSYAITQSTFTAGANYDLTFVPAKLHHCLGQHGAGGQRAEREHQ